jgi:DNA-binding CsgD family transcriptional regulator
MQHLPRDAAEASRAASSEGQDPVATHDRGRLIDVLRTAAQAAAASVIAGSPTVEGWEASLQHIGGLVVSAFATGLLASSLPADLLNLILWVLEQWEPSRAGASGWPGLAALMAVARRVVRRVRVPLAPPRPAPPAVCGDPPPTIMAAGRVRVGEPGHGRPDAAATIGTHQPGSSRAAPVPAEVRTDPTSLPLNTKELRIARLALLGKTNRQIARQLSLTDHTINYYFRRIFTKLGIQCRIQLAAALPPDSDLMPLDQSDRPSMHPVDHADEKA